MQNKHTIIWFVDATGLPGSLLSAKMMQIRDWVQKTNPFGEDTNFLIVPARENKFSLLETDEEFKGKFTSEKQAIDWLASVKNKLKDCLEVHLYEKGETPKLRDVK